MSGGKVASQTRESNHRIEKTLRQYKYLARPRAEKGLLRQYLCKMSGYSPAQPIRLIDQFHSATHLRVRPYRRHCPH